MPDEKINDEALAAEADRRAQQKAADLSKQMQEAFIQLLREKGKITTAGGATTDFEESEARYQGRLFSRVSEGGIRAFEEK